MVLLLEQVQNYSFSGGIFHKLFSKRRFSIIPQMVTWHKGCFLPLSMVHVWIKACCVSARAQLLLKTCCMLHRCPASNMNLNCSVIPKHFQDHCTLRNCEWLLSWWMIGVKLPQINKQIVEWRKLLWSFHFVIVCRAKWFTLIINLLGLHLSTGFSQDSVWVDQPGPQGCKPHLLSVMNGRWAVDFGARRWREPSWGRLLQSCEPDWEGLLFSDLEWCFFRSVWIICLPAERAHLNYCCLQTRRFLIRVSAGHWRNRYQVLCICSGSLTCTFVQQHVQNVMTGCLAW